METLERESPKIITLEMSEYGVAFRERIGPRLKERSFGVLRGLLEWKNRGWYGPARSVYEPSDQGDLKES